MDSFERSVVARIFRKAALERARRGFGIVEAGGLVQDFERPAFFDVVLFMVGLFRAPQAQDKVNGGRPVQMCFRAEPGRIRCGHES